MGLFDYNPNDPNASYNQMEMRRKIALGMMAQSNKKGYPKNLGEGLAHIGDTIGDIGVMKLLERQEQQRQAALNTAADAARGIATGSPTEVRPVPGGKTYPAPAAAAPAAAAPAPQAAADPPEENSPLGNVQPAKVATAEDQVVGDDANVTNDGLTPQDYATAGVSRTFDQAMADRPPNPAPGTVTATGDPDPRIVATADFANKARQIPPAYFSPNPMSYSANNPPPTDRFAMPPSAGPQARAQAPVAGAAEPAAAPAAAAASPSPAVAGYRQAPAYLRQALADSGLPPERQAYLGHLASKEAQSPTEVSSTGAAGPFQFTRGTGREYGLNGPGFDNRTDIKASIAAVNKLTDYNASVLERGLGRPPTPGELALAHQQGAGTAVKMLTGTGNASASNLAVNNASGSGPQAANKIMAYYGMPSGDGSQQAAASPRDRVATALVAQGQSPADAPPDAQDSRLSEVTGMSGRGGGYSYPPTASLRTGNVVSDAPQPGITGAPSEASKVGAGVVDTLQNRNDAIRATPPAPEVPPPNPTLAGPSQTPQPPISPASTLAATTAGSPSAAAGNRQIVTDIQKAPDPALQPGTQLAQAADIRPPSVPANPPPPNPTIADPQVPRPVPAAPRIEDVPYSPQQRQLMELKNRAEISGDPAMIKMYENYIAPFEAARQSEYARRQKIFDKDLEYQNTQRSAEQEFRRSTDERQLRINKELDEAGKRAKEEKLAQRRGGVPVEAYVKNIEKSYETVKGIPATSQQLAAARKLITENRMFTGSNAEIDTSLAKLGGVLGFPVNPKASGTEQFKSYMAGVTAQARQALVGGANISDRDLEAAEKAAAAKATLEPGTIIAALDAAERINLQAGIAHQKKVDRMSMPEDTDSRSAVHDTYGIDLTHAVPQAAVDRLRQHPEEAAMFDETFHSPGLSRKVLTLRR